MSGEKKMIFNLNGKLVKDEDAKISVLDRGFIYGDGIYETVLVRNGRPYLLDRHLKRLRNSAAITRMEVTWDDDTFTREVDRLLEANGLTNAAIRINMSRGVGDWRLNVDGASNPTYLLSLFPIPDYPPDTYTRGWDVVISRKVMTMDPVIPALAKTTNRLSLILAKIEAQERGGKEAILLNLEGKLTEGTSSNLFFVKEGAVCTPSLVSGILEGITRAVVMEILGREGIDVREALFGPEDLLSAEEAFLTFTTAGVVPIHHVDGRQIGEGQAGPITRVVLEKYDREVEASTNPL